MDSLLALACGQPGTAPEQAARHISVASERGAEDVSLLLVWSFAAREQDDRKLAADVAVTGDKEL